LIAGADKVAYIYKITNMLNGMNYIGVTVNPKNRFISHCRKPTTTRLPLKNAIQKHGKENFKMEILVKSTQEYCYKLEPKIIELFNTQKPFGYNLSKGGMGSLGLVGSVNGCYGRTNDKHPNFGKKGCFTGRKHSEETKSKMRKARLGRKHSDEVRAKISIATKENFSNPEHIEKMKKAGFCIGRFRKRTNEF
jgi:group I intron endonuclease